MNSKELVARAGRWRRNKHGCSFAGRKKLRSNNSIGALLLGTVLVLTLVVRVAIIDDHERTTTAASPISATPSSSSSLLLLPLKEIHSSRRRLKNNNNKGQEHHHRFEEAMSNMDFSEYSCDHLYHHDMNETSRCAFARTCNDGDGIFAPFVFCSEKYTTRTLVLLVGPPLVLLLILLFRILGSTAEEFFSPGLEMMSLQMGLPERFAGVTLLALGNGAPDVASTVNAITHDTKMGYLLALGELTGTAMVASTVIVGAVAFFSADRVLCRGALVRDVVMFILTMVVVYWAFDNNNYNNSGGGNRGKKNTADGMAIIGLSEIRIFVIMYFAYVLVVLAADLYHRRVVMVRRKLVLQQQKQQQQRDVTRKEPNGGTVVSVSAAPACETTSLLLGADDLSSRKNKGRSYSIGSYELENVSTTSPEVKRRDRGDSVWSYEMAQSDQSRQIGRFERFMEALSNYDVEATNNILAETPATGDGQERKDGFGKAQSFERSETNGMHQQQQQQQQGRAFVSERGWVHVEEGGPEPLMVFHPHRGGMVDLKHTERFETPIGTTEFLERMGEETVVEEDHHRNASGNDDDADVIFMAGPAPKSWGEAWTKGWSELADYVTKFWKEMYFSDEYNSFDKFLMTCELPFMIPRLLSIPVPCDGYYCRPLLGMSIALSPLWLCYYFWDQFDVDILENSFIVVFSVFFLPLLLGLVVLRFAPCGDVPPRLSVAVPITLIGFVVSATFLDLIADRLVSLLTFLGIICRIPNTIMGLTVLAWGNSSQDLIANMTVARKGLSTMAITASFAGPVFNILIGLGIGMAILYSLGDPIYVQLNEPLKLGFLFSVLNGVLVLINGLFVGRGFLPKKYGYVAITIYSAYVIASLTM